MNESRVAEASRLCASQWRSEARGPQSIDDDFWLPREELVKNQDLTSFWCPDGFGIGHGMGVEGHQFLGGLIFGKYLTWGRSSKSESWVQRVAFVERAVA